MNIQINGEARELPADTTISGLLQTLGLAEKRVAVECNGELVPKSLHGERRLEDSDRVEIVQAIGGG
jgi:sulfur carrier protein